jgi:16S rRNA (cytosine1402-N4)-methyltransferase
MSAGRSNAALDSVAWTESQLALPGLEDASEWIWAEEEELSLVQYSHVTVLRSEVVDALASAVTHAPAPAALVVDATLGGGGHTEAILEAYPSAHVIGFDRDLAAIDAATERLARFGDRFRAVHAPFASAKEELGRLGVLPIMALVADLGVSSPQLDDPARGMSFRHEGPLDMRMDRTQGETALELIERLDDDALANVIYDLGEERRSRRIARSVKRALAAGELHTTTDLRRAVVRATGPVRVGGVDPATRTFQALRIAVNRELDELDALLAIAPELLAPGGIAAIISFHSLEDRRVKRTFSGSDAWKPLTKKPIVASDPELEQNPRARSAKLRAAALVDRTAEGEEEGDEG